MILALFSCLLSIHSNILSSASTVYVNINNPSNGNGKSWSTAYTSLSDAVSNSAAGDEIWITQGTYYAPNKQSSSDRSATFSITKHLSVYGGFKGTETSINQRPNPLLDTILSGNIGDQTTNTDNSYHIITILTDNSLFDGLIIEGGYSHNDSISDYKSCATCFGGGMYQTSFQKRQQDACKVVINQCTFRNNTAISGGALFGFGSPNYFITNSLFESNSAIDSSYKGGYGGAITIAMWGNMSVTNTTFRNNFATGSGGASHCDYGMYCTYSECEFNNNTVKEGNGAALSSIDRDSQRGSSELTVNKCTFNNNICQNTKPGSGGLGGAVYLFDNNAFGYITNSVFNSNSANLGGAIGVYGGSHCRTCCETNSKNTFNNNIGANGDNDCYIGQFPYYETLPVIIDNPLQYLQLLYNDKDKYNFSEPPNCQHIVYVNKQSNTVKPDGTSWSKAFNILQDGIDAAENIIHSDRTATVEIWVVGGGEKYKYIPQRVPKWYNFSAPYYDAQLSKMVEIPENIKLFGGFIGTETKRIDRNWNVNPTIIDGFLTSTTQVYQVVYVHENVWLDGFLIGNGKTLAGPPHSSEYGSNNLRQTNPNQILFDQTPVRGAGIFSNVSLLNIANTLFYSHYSTKGSGLYVLGNPNFLHNVTGYNLGFVGNYATDRGGAFGVDLRGEFNCIGCKFWSNVCSHKGGAVYSDFSSHSIFDQCMFYNNTGYDSGGAIGMDAGYSQITNSNFTQNYAFSEGAATYTGSYNPYIASANYYIFSNNIYNDNVCSSGVIDHYLWLFDYWIDETQN